MPMTFSDNELLDIWALMKCARNYSRDWGGTRHLLHFFPDSSELDSQFRIDDICKRIEKYLQKKGDVVDGCTRQQYEFELETGRRPIFNTL